MAMAMSTTLHPSNSFCFTTQTNQFHNSLNTRNKFTVISSLSSGAAPTKRKEAILAKDDLLNLISGEERGLKTESNPSKRTQIIKAIDALAVLGEDIITTDSSSLSATWRMLWTTEKEQLFIIEKAPLFGTQVGDVLQVIDVDKASLNNVITFPPTGAFVVDSTIQVASLQRINFRFTSAVLQGANWKIPLPPFGQGWFESIYLDENFRVAKDIRGDYLVVDRAPYVWEGK